MRGHPLLHHFYCGPRSLLISILLSLWLTMTNMLSVVAQSVADKLVCSAASHWEIHHSRATQLESATSTAHSAVAHGTFTLRTVNTHMQSRCCRVRYLHSGINASITSIILSVSVYSPMYCTHTRTLAHTHTCTSWPRSLLWSSTEGWATAITMETGEQHIPHSILSESEDESSPHYRKQTTCTHTHTRTHTWTHTNILVLLCIFVRTFIGITKPLTLAPTIPTDPNHNLNLILN